MPTSSRETNTMAEGLRKILNEITGMKMMPDADLDFLIGQLETPILQYLRNPVGPAQPPAQMGGSMGGGMPGGPPPGPAGPGMAVPLINPDELSRMLGPGARP